MISNKALLSLPLFAFQPNDHTGGSKSSATRKRGGDAEQAKFINLLKCLFCYSDEEVALNLENL